MRHGENSFLFSSRWGEKKKKKQLLPYYLNVLVLTNSTTVVLLYPILPHCTEIESSCKKQIWNYL